MLFLLEFLGQVAKLLFETVNFSLALRQSMLKRLHFHFLFAPSPRRLFALLLLLLLDLMQLVVHRPLPGHGHNLLRTDVDRRQFSRFLFQKKNE